jgi:hypothetical protein
MRVNSNDILIAISILILGGLIMYGTSTIKITDPTIPPVETPVETPIPN